MIHAAAAKRLGSVLAASICFMTKNLVESVECGKWYSTACLAEIDKRYDTSYTNDIKEQNPLWAQQEGFWMALTQSFDANDQPNQPKMFDPTNLATGFGLPYTRATKTAYANITMSGSRYYEHRYTVWAPAPQDFCDKPVIPPARNALFGGTCGVNGYAAWTENYATASYEKDGSLRDLGGSISFSQDTGFNPLEGMKMAIGSDTLFAGTEATNQGGATTSSTVWTFTNKANTKANAQRTEYNTIGDESFLLGYSKIAYTKITEEQFISGIKDMWSTNQVQQDNRGALPMEECIGEGGCVTEEDWCVSDPSCNVSPYQEPAASTKGGVIAGFTIAGAVVVIAALYVLHLHAVKTQKEKMRKTLIKGITSNANAGSSQGLSVDNLVEEFKKIDTSGDGFVQKSELKTFVQSGKIGELSDKEFDKMFAAIDGDKSGEIDFIEFVNFVGQCPTGGAKP